MLYKSAALAALALLLVIAVRPAPASDALKGPGIIRITDRELDSATVDAGRPGRSPGDLEVTRKLLYNTRITPKSIGHAELVCTFTGVSSRNCSGTYSLPAGKIVVSGPVLFRQFFQLAVVGGTGRYDNVRGTLTVTSLGRKPRRDLVLFRLVL
jgi:hypothetical protein